MTTTDKAAMTEYDEQAARFLKDTGTTFEIKFADEECPAWEQDDKHIHGNHYRFVLIRGGRSYASDYWNSYKDALKDEIKKAHDMPDSIFALKYRTKIVEASHAVKPSAYDVLASLESYVSESFEDFCDYFGYDTDSRRAVTTYHAATEQVTALQTLFNDDEMQLLADIA